MFTPAAQAYRDRHFTRHAELHDQRTTIQAQLNDLTAAATPDQDPALLDEPPYLAGQLHDAPAALIEALLTALDIQVLYRPEQQQATIWATFTDTTPATITALLQDPASPRATPPPSHLPSPPPPAPISESAQRPMAPFLATIMKHRKFRARFGTFAPGLPRFGRPSSTACIPGGTTGVSLSVQAALTGPGQRRMPFSPAIFWLVMLNLWSLTRANWTR